MAEVVSKIFYWLDPKRIDVQFDDGTSDTFYSVKSYSIMFPDLVDEAIQLFNTNQITPD